MTCGTPGRYRRHSGSTGCRGWTCGASQAVKTSVRHTRTSSTTVSLHPLDESRIRRYVREINALKSAFFRACWRQPRDGLVGARCSTAARLTAWGSCFEALQLDEVPRLGDRRPQRAQVLAGRGAGGVGVALLQRFVDGFVLGYRLLAAPWYQDRAQLEPRHAQPQGADQLGHGVVAGRAVDELVETHVGRRVLVVLLVCQRLAHRLDELGHLRELFVGDALGSKPGNGHLQRLARDE